MAEIGLGGEQYEGVDDTTRQSGIETLKRRMGGDVPWYKERASTKRQAKIDQNLDMMDSIVTDRKVPRRTED